MTDLTGTIVRERNLSFRVAHEIVAEVVTRALAENKTGNQVTTKMIDGASTKVMGNFCSYQETRCLKRWKPPKM